MPKRYAPKMPKIPNFQKDTERPAAWKRLEKFLLRMGCAPQKDGTWPVNYADAVSFALEEVRLAKRGPKVFKDPAVNVLQEVRRLKHTCPGCGQPVASGEPLTSKKGDFLWHNECQIPIIERRSDRDLLICVEEAETDLRGLVDSVLEAETNTTSGYRLKLKASELRDKYADAMFFGRSREE